MRFPAGLTQFCVNSRSVLLRLHILFLLVEPEFFSDSKCTPLQKEKRQNKCLDVSTVSPLKIYEWLNETLPSCDCNGHNLAKSHTLGVGSCRLCRSLDHGG